MTISPCIIVTGASGGIGSALLQLLSDHPMFSSHQLIGLDVKKSDNNKSHVYSGQTSAPEHIRIIEADVSDANKIDAVFSRLEEEYLFTGVVNGAGILHYGKALHTKTNDVNRLLDVNAKGVFNVSNAAARAMIRQQELGLRKGQSSIVTVASNAATGPRAMFSAYGASKAFASHYARSLGLEIAPHGIRCNVVCPGTTATSMLDAIWGNEDQSAATIAGSPSDFRNGIPLQKIAQPREIAETIAFLLSPASSHITLAEITVDGGATQR